MNCIKSRSDRLTTTESWSPSPHVACHPLRVSSSAAQSNVRSLDISDFSKHHRYLSAVAGLFAFRDKNDYRLEDSRFTMDSTAHCLCQDGHENSYPQQSRSYLGNLPEVDEEMSIPFLPDLRGSRSTPFDENSKLCYTYTRPESTLEFLYSNPSSFDVENSLGTSFYSANAVKDSQQLPLEEEILVNSSLSGCTLGQARNHDDRRMLLSTPGKFDCVNQDGSDIFNSEIPFDPMSTFSSLQCGELQSPGYGVQYRHRQGAFVPLRHKQAMNNSTSILPSSSSVSLYLEETENLGEHPQLKVGLYKTELCRSWEETDFCRYGAKCQFAHGNDDLRPVPRHPKYKTEVIHRYWALQLRQTLSVRPQLKYYNAILTAVKKCAIGEDKLKEIVDISTVVRCW